MEDLENFVKLIELMDKKDIVNIIDNFDYLNISFDNENKNFNVVINFLLLLNENFTNDTDIDLYWKNLKHYKELKKLLYLLSNYNMFNKVENLNIKIIKDIQIMKFLNLKKKYYCLKFLDVFNNSFYINFSKEQLDIFIEKMKHSIKF